VGIIRTTLAQGASRRCVFRFRVERARCVGYVNR
jgi:hypothetical protein